MTMNFCKRSYQPILRYLYTEVKKRRSEISLYKHFKKHFRTLLLLGLKQFFLKHAYIVRNTRPVCNFHIFYGVSCTKRFARSHAMSCIVIGSIVN